MLSYTQACIGQSLIEDIEATMDIMGFGRDSAYNESAGSVNPDNEIARLNGNDGGMYFRPNIRYRGDHLSFWFDPRLNFDMEPQSTSKYNLNRDYFVQSLKARFQVNESMYLMAGRYIKEIGPSVLYNPSNPFVIETGRLNPKLEIKSMDFIEANIAVNTEWEATLIANVGSADNEIYREPFFKFEETYGLLVDYFGMSENYSFLVSSNDRDQHHIALFGQKTVSDSVLMWTELALDKNINRFYAIERTGSGGASLVYDVVNGEKNQKWFSTALVGLSYSFEFGPTMKLEYFYTEKGLAKQQANVFFDAVEEASNQIQSPFKQLSVRNLARSINTGQPYLRRNHIFLQIGENDIQGIFSYSLRYMYSMDDGSRQHSGVLEWFVTDSLEMFLVGLVNDGHQRSNFGRLVEHQFMFGFIKRI